MVNVIMGKRGSGKTKRVIDMVNAAVNQESGHVVCIEKGQNLRFNITYNAKLIDVNEYAMELNYDSLFVFICGLYCGNYDITHMFIDSLYKITGDDDDSKAVDFLHRLSEFADQTNVKFTITISADIESASPELQKFLI